uniref:ADAM_CR_2 domain-containing protein n=1 Tax=Macrostomum lignano TaxID=282301 RepID=A0A1I8H665_9PLAT
MLRIVIFLLAVAAAQASVSVTRSSNDGPHPSSMEIEVQLPSTNKKVRIPLEKTDAFESVPMTVRENGVSRTFSARQAHHASHAHYRDIESKSVISVRHEKGKKRFSGHVMHEGTSYFVKPSGASEHQVTRNIAQPDGIESQIDKSKVMQVMSRKKRQSNQAATDLEVELLLLLDHTVWNAYDRASLYYTHILNGIDTAFRNVGNPSMSVKCTGLTVAKTQADSQWMPPAGSSDATDASAILGYIKSYAVGKTADHVMAFTRTDIQSGGNTAVCGMAYVGGACQDTRVSINEDQGLQSWGTASHELAHNMGSDHDNDQPACKVAYKFLMSPSAGRVKALQTPLWLQRLAKGGRMTLDQVCRLAYPSSPGKFFLTDDVSSNPALICAKIFCTPTAGSSSGVTGGGLRAPVGTPCGNKKSCNWDGQCASDTSAPEADESCFWGDSWGDTCTGWKDYIKYLRDNNDLGNAKTYCGQCQSGCCRSVKTLCTF